MKKTLCYKAVARKTGEMVSDGFIVEEFVLPCTVTLVLKDGNKFEIEIIDRVFDKQLENYYQESLKKLKSSIFPKSGE